MKSEHRHELKTNELRKYSAAAGDYLQEHANQLLIALSVILLVVAAAIYWMRTTGASGASGWSAMVNAGTAEEYLNVADRYRGTAVGAWARLRAAENNLENGIRLSFTDRASAVSDLNEAKKEYESLLNSPDTPEDVRERALFGMARTLETLSDGDTGPAVTSYELLLKEFPNSIYKEGAEGRIADLRSERTKQFYAWFHKQSPKPADREKPKDGPAATTPEAAPDTTGDIPLDAAQPAAGADAASPPAVDDAPADTETTPDDSPAADNNPSGNSADNGEADSSPAPSGEPRTDDSASTPAPATDGEDSP